LKNCNDGDGDTAFAIPSLTSVQDLSKCFGKTTSGAGTLSVSSGSLYLTTNTIYFESVCNIEFSVSDGDLDNPIITTGYSSVNYIDGI